MKHYAASRKVAGSGPHKVNIYFFSNLAHPSTPTRPWGSLSL
jgi:hypothetical protein